VDARIRHLGKPPIVEAVIHWQARGERPFDLEGWKEALTKQLPGYGSPEPIQQFEAMMFFQEDASSSSHKRRVEGLRYTSDDKRQIVQFKRDGVVFSRLEPYENWEQLLSAASPVWQVFLQFAAPREVDRLGVRFINRLPGVKPDGLDRVFREPLTCPANLPLSEFVYQSTFRVPEEPLAIRVIKLLQPIVASDVSDLFIDCDVFTTKPMPCDPRSTSDALARMRMLKNLIFFSLLTDEKLRSFE